jgi:hypothetical protein
LFFVAARRKYREAEAAFRRIHPLPAADFSRNIMIRRMQSECCTIYMIRPSIICLLAVGLLAAGGCAIETARHEPGVMAETKAIEFLKREVPAWRRDNGCFSCHNNGDAARALYAASRKGYRIPVSVLAETSEWGSHPDRWEHNQGDPGFSDQRLANVQFTASLAAAAEARMANDAEAMKGAVLRVANDQAEDGSWPIDAANAVGSPTTYGVTLATYMAWDSLRRVSSPEISVAKLKAEEKLRAAKPDSVPNAAVWLLFQSKCRGGEADNPDDRRRNSPPRHGGGHESALDFLRSAQTSDGGWGPYADSPPEVFDTALALLALADYRAENDVPEMIQRGRNFLTSTQLPDGSWPATTRPPGGQSYAQQMSTTGWATLALLATR